MMKNDTGAQNAAKVNSVPAPHKKRRLRPGSAGFSLLCLALSLLFCTGGAVAWLSRNRYVQSQQMKVSATVTPNLVIAQHSASAVTQPIQSGNILHQGADPFSVVMSSSAAGLTAATHDDSKASKLAYVENTADLDRSTGLFLDGTTPSMKNAAEGVHYVDFTVDLAAAGAELSGVNLVARIDSPASGGGDTIDALAVDFWVTLTKGGSSTYIGTLNVAGQDYRNITDPETGGYIDKDEISIISGGTIKLNTADYITVKMRVYFDGALLKNEEETYLKAYNLDTSEINLCVSFSAEDAS